MGDKDQNKKVSLLLLETGQAHHRAYIDTDGVDPEWPLWYADYLMDRLPVVLGRELTKSEIVYCLVDLSKKQPVIAPKAWWPDFYADYFLEKHP
jgi:hypothetical protein